MPGRGYSPIIMSGPLPVCYTPDKQSPPTVAMPGMLLPPSGMPGAPGAPIQLPVATHYTEKADRYRQMSAESI